MWKEIEGYEGYYAINESGEVKSLARIVKNNGHDHRVKERIRKVTNTGSYPVVSLRKNGILKVWPIHILLAKAFIPNPNNYPCVNHIDGDKTNYNVENLEWCTYSYNNAHALANNLRSPRGTSVVQYDLDGNFIAEYKSAAEAARSVGTTTAMICHCTNHRCKTASGFIWVKKSEGATTIREE